MTRLAKFPDFNQNDNMAIIEPRALKGFRDFLPAAEIARRELTERIEGCFRSFGFVPIDTPALEYAEILLGKSGGETEKQIYRFRDNGDRDVALRFDLTVPFARFLAEHRADLTLPFKRYHIAKVWRGENTQKGRYREFTQCDFDIVGSDSAAADFEILLMMQKSLRAAGAGDVKIRVNHRGLFNRFLEKINALDHSAEILRTVDKLGKIGREETLALLAAFLDEDRGKKILDFVTAKSSWDDTFTAMVNAAGSGPEAERLSRIRQFIIDTGTENYFFLDPSITRGLDYYTGVVFETFLQDMPGIGSVCSGGRYDNLVGLYSKESITGVGAAIGLDRLIAALENLERLPERHSYADTAIACVSEENGGRAQALGMKFREEGISCEVMLEGSREKLAKQFALAEKKGVRFLVIPDEKNPAESITLRDLRNRENIEGISVDEAAALIRQIQEDAGKGIV
ncbi:histidine--tRNA ligase [Spirochaetia bacterium]|nr:histidine--tRNA ligase [Spirochaetia bacterium]